MIRGCLDSFISFSSLTTTSIPLHIHLLPSECEGDSTHSRENQWMIFLYESQLFVAGICFSSSALSSVISVFVPHCPFKCFGQNILGICWRESAAPALIIYEYLLIYCFALFMRLSLSLPGGAKGRKGKTDKDFVLILIKSTVAHRLNLKSFIEPNPSPGNLWLFNCSKQQSKESWRAIRDLWQSNVVQCGIVVFDSVLIIRKL